MGMETLIFSYHYTVITIILMTTIATIGGMGKIWIFKNVDASYTKILVGALLIELVAAFIGVYNTLPELKLKVSEKYKFEIEYSDLTKPWVEKLSESDRELVEYFINKGGLKPFLDFKETVEDYELMSDLSRVGGTEWIKYYKDKLIRRKQREHISLYIDIFQSSPFILEQAEQLLFKYTRLVNASSKKGQGDMWASLSKDKLEGIVVYEFPGDLVPTVLEFNGRKDKEGMVLSFKQKSSAFPAADQMFLRKEQAFTVPLKLENDVYVGDFLTIGVMKVQLWEL